jgi:hypothetical protein
MVLKLAKGKYHLQFLHMRKRLISRHHHRKVEGRPEAGAAHRKGVVVDVLEMQGVSFSLLKIRSYPQLVENANQLRIRSN